MIKIKYSNGDFSVPNACCDGDVFYIIRDKAITAVRINEAVFRDRAIYGRFVCADGTEMDDFRLLCAENIDYGDSGVMLTNSPVKDSNRYDVYESVDDARKGVSMGVMRLSSLCVKDFGLIGCGDVDFDSTGSCKFIARGYRIDDSLSVSYCSATLKTSRFLRDENGLVCVELLDTSGHAFSFGRDVYASHDDAETFASRIRNDAEVIAFSDARKAYDVHVHFDMCVRVEGVRASDEEEAERKAKDVAAGMNLDEYAECVGVTACVVE